MAPESGTPVGVLPRLAYRCWRSVCGRGAGFALFLALGAAAAGAKAEWKSGLGYRFRPVNVAGGAAAGFVRMEPAATGIGFTNHLSDRAMARNRLLANGSGVALGDADGDGQVDIYLCRLEGPNALYRNRGDWTFEDITAATGVACPDLLSTGCAMADLDGDGDLDLLVNALGGGTRAFLNDGRARFTEMTGTRLVRELGATSLALGDIDGDGDLDLYVANYRTDTFHDPPLGDRPVLRQLADGRTTVEPQARFLGLPTPSGTLEVLERGEPDILYLNRGGTNFVPAPWNVGVFLDESGNALASAPTDWGLSVMFRDFNGDGLPDLYVCNDFVFWPDRLWLNQGGRRFQAAPIAALRTMSLASMCLDVADINRDGFDDFFVADMPVRDPVRRLRQRPDMLGGTVRWPVWDPSFRPETPRNTLQLNRGDGTYAEIARQAGVAATDWTWAAAFLDVDLDGWEDLLLTAGNPHDLQDVDTQMRLARTGGWRTPERRIESYRQFPSRAAPQLAFRNRRDLTFADMSHDWGFDTVGVAHGLALGDLDNDGDLDVVVNCLNGPARVFCNRAASPRLGVRLRGAGGNTRGIGARIRVTGGPVPQSQEMMAGGRYCSSDDPMRTFAAGNAQLLDVEVTWRSGRQTRVRGVAPNGILEISEAASVDPAPAPAMPETLFAPEAVSLPPVSGEPPAPDSTSPGQATYRPGSGRSGLAWSDLDGDGDDDLVVGSPRGGALTVFQNDGVGHLKPWPEFIAVPQSDRDQTAVLAWKHEGKVRLVVGQSNWDSAETNGPPFSVLGIGGSLGAPGPISGGGAATGPLALADVDGDGDLDLFVGARCAAGRYPEAGDSAIWENRAGNWRAGQRFPGLALVHGATFTDWDGDGDPDLVLACDWDSLRLFRNEAGRFVEITKDMGLEAFRGLWNGVAAGDFDGDGRMDLVASNRGRNWRMDRPDPEGGPVWIRYGDFAGTGGVQSLLSSDDPAAGREIPWADLGAMKAVVPALGERFYSFEDYSRAPVAEILAGMSGVRSRSAAWFSSTVFLNRGDRFEARPLPAEAQFSAAFGISVADFDGDGREDLFLAQNDFGGDPASGRLDAGTGLILLGDGRGAFRPLRPAESGIRMDGEQRGCAVGDFDRDGRPDLAVGQVRGATQLWRNLRGHPGIRVQVEGPAGNPDAFGASCRLEFPGGWGPRRELGGGGGYRSQDSATLMLAAPTEPIAVEVVWPGGVRRRFPWIPGRRSAVVSEAGPR